MKYTKVIIILLTVLLSSGEVFSQDNFRTYTFDTTKTYIIELLDETIFVGEFLHKDSSIVVIKTANLPKVEIPFKSIIKIKMADDTNFKEGSYWFPNPNDTRYLFGPSAYSLKKGEGYYQNTYLILNSVNVGITDHLTIGGGLEIITLFNNESGTPIFFINPKIGYSITDKVNAGAGFIYATLDGTGAGIFYGIGTYGSPDHNLTCGFGYGAFDNELADNPIITISGMTRIAKKTSLITENWFVPMDGRYYSIYSYGIRFFGEKIAVDLAFLNNADIIQELIIGIPYIDFVVKF